MKILVNARLISGRNGGVEQAIIGLADAFKVCNYPDIEFFWLVYKNNAAWISAHLPKNSILVEIEDSGDGRAIRAGIAKLLRLSMWGNLFLAFLRKRGPLAYDLPPEPRIVAEIRPDLIHFPTQFGFKTKYPNIYQPHDLQHIHFPEFFSREVLELRKIGYRIMIEQASKVVVGNDWTKLDFESNYPKAMGKFENVPVFPQVFFESTENFMGKDRVTNTEYLLYPAAGWKHKNHLRLLRSFAKVVEGGETIELVLTGSHLKGNRQILREIKKLNIVNQVHVVGFVAPDHLARLYQHAKAVIVPTLFESASFPIWEAFNFGIPVLAARTSSLPAQAKDCAKFFDPLSIESMVAAILEVLSGDPAVMDRVLNGKERVAQFTALNTAIGYRYVYRRALNLLLDQDDSIWLQNGIRF
jgi:glycosyltransferase involved in cell wall biosynthesis